MAWTTVDLGTSVTRLIPNGTKWFAPSGTHLYVVNDPAFATHGLVDAPDASATDFGSIAVSATRLFYLGGATEIYRSSDGLTGAAWEQVPTIPPIDPATTVQAIGANGSRLGCIGIVGGERKMITSDDSGATWTVRGVVPTAAGTLRLVAGASVWIVHRNTFADGTALAYSLDNGVTWAAHTFPAGEQMFGVGVAGSVLFATVYITSTNLVDLRRSTDGVTWASVGDARFVGAPWLCISGQVAGATDQIWVARTGVSGGATEAFASVDGVTFTGHPDTLPSDVYPDWITQGNDTLVFGVSGGLAYRIRWTPYTPPPPPPPAGTTDADMVQALVLNALIAGSNLTEVSFSSGAAIQASAVGNTLASGIATSAIVIEADIGLSRIAIGLVQSGLVMLTPTDLQCVLNALLFSRLGISNVTPAEGSGLAAWAVNLENRGSTRYENYEFNSYAKIGDSYFGCKPDGIYALDGDTDAGEPIQAMVSFGKQDFGSTAMKRVSNIYLGASSTGKLYVKVLVEGQEYLYAARDSSEDLQTQRVDLGRGLRANYLEFELYNADGDDFELASVEFAAVPLTRRI